jgi:threonine dehydratase
MVKLFQRKTKSPEKPKLTVISAPNRRRINVEEVYAARQAMAPFIRRTPLVQVVDATLGQGIARLGALHLKLENLQVTGSFKARGALSYLLQQDEAILTQGVVTASGGNHGIAVAYAAKQRGVPARIYVPESINPEKRRYMNEWGGETITAGPIFQNALAMARKVAAEENIPFVHTFGDRMVICGQGTVALEILETLPDVDVLVVAIGGGGLIGGMAIAAHAINPKIRIIGVEPVGAPTLFESIKAGKAIKLAEVNTRAGTLSMSQTTKLNFDLVRDHVDDIVLVSDAEMQQAARWLWFEMGIAAELSGAAAVAALRCGRIKLRGDERVCAVVCGAGTDGIG